MCDNTAVWQPNMTVYEPTAALNLSRNFLIQADINMSNIMWSPFCDWIKAYLLNLIEFAYEEDHTDGANDFSDLICSCTSIRRFLAVSVDWIITIVKRHDGMGKCVRVYAGSFPAWVFLKRHLSYSGSVGLTVGIVMWAKHLYGQRKWTDKKQVWNVMQWGTDPTCFLIWFYLTWWALSCHTFRDFVKCPQWNEKVGSWWQKTRTWLFTVTVRWNVRVYRWGVSSSNPGTLGVVPDSTISVPG